MKKTSLVLAMSVLCAGMQAQLFTGIDTYVHSGITDVLSDGHLTTTYPGFLMAGYQPAAAPNTANIFIDKTDVDGSFNGSTGEFKKQYFFSTGLQPCSTPMYNAINCYGTSILECGISSTKRYIMTAAFDNGVMYSFLDDLGGPNPSGTNFFTFPYQASNATKPVIAQSGTGLAAQFFVAGAYLLGSTWYMYVMHFNGTSLAWKNIYAFGSNTELIPRGIIVSPYAPISTPEVVVVGQYNNNLALSEQGFFARLDDNSNGTVTQFSTYGSNTSSNEQFWSITKSNMPGINQGYIIGGYSDLNPSFGTPWMVKIDPAGAILWSTILRPTSIPSKFVGVIERFNTYGQYECHGVTDSNSGMTVIKLDAANGNLFSKPGNLINEFIYNDNSGGNSFPAAIDYIDIPSNVNDGIHVYGTNNNSPTLGDHFLVRACFNGAAGSCAPNNTSLNTLPPSFQMAGPSQVVPQTINLAAHLTPCTNFIFNYSSSAVNVDNPCDGTSLPTMPWIGNQNRTAAVTGIAELSNTTAQLSVSPNPVSDRLSINYTAALDSKVTITLTNQLGQVVMPPVTTTTSQNENSFELDMDKMNLKSGIYFVGININGVNTTRKIVYTK